MMTKAHLSSVRRIPAPVKGIQGTQRTLENTEGPINSQVCLKGTNKEQEQNEGVSQGNVGEGHLCWKEKEKRVEDNIKYRTRFYIDHQQQARNLCCTVTVEECVPCCSECVEKREEEVEGQPQQQQRQQQQPRQQQQQHQGQHNAEQQKRGGFVGWVVRCCNWIWSVLRGEACLYALHLFVLFVGGINEVVDLKSKGWSAAELVATLLILLIRTCSSSHGYYEILEVLLSPQLGPIIHHHFSKKSKSTNQRRAIRSVKYDFSSNTVVIIGMNVCSDDANVDSNVDNSNKQIHTNVDNINLESHNEIDSRNLPSQNKMGRSVQDNNNTQSQHFVDRNVHSNNNNNVDNNSSADNNNMHSFDNIHEDVHLRVIKYWMIWFVVSGSFLIILCFVCFWILFYFDHLNWTILSNNLALITMGVLSELFRARVNSAVAQIRKDHSLLVLWEANLVIKEEINDIHEKRSRARERQEAIGRSGAGASGGTIGAVDEGRDGRGEGGGEGRGKEVQDERVARSSQALHFVRTLSMTESFSTYN